MEERKRYSHVWWNSTHWTHFAGFSLSALPFSSCLLLRHRRRSFLSTLLFLLHCKCRDECTAKIAALAFNAPSATRNLLLNCWVDCLTAVLSHSLTRLFFCHVFQCKRKDDTKDILVFSKEQINWSGLSVSVKSNACILFHLSHSLTCHKKCQRCLCLLFFFCSRVRNKPRVGVDPFSHHLSHCLWHTCLSLEEETTT